MMSIGRRIAALAALLFVSVTPSKAETAEEFFKKTSQLRLIVSSSPGGGYDTFARLVAKYMGPRLPGNPSIIVQNMPGGGGMRAANHLYSVAPKDGSTFAIIDRGILTATLLYGPDSNAQFDSSKFLWLGSVAQEFGVGILGANAPARTLEDAKTKELAFGASGQEGDTSMYTRLFNTLFGTKFKSIPAYAGQTEYYLAMTKGETDGLFMSGWSGPNKIQAQDDHKNGRIRYFVQITDKRHPDFGDVPTITELLKTPEERQMVDVILSRLKLGRPFITPPEVPADRLAILRTAFKGAVEDPNFRADAARQGIVVDPIYGEEAQAMLAQVLATPEDVVKRLRQLFKP